MRTDRSSAEPASTEAIVFFDGECGLCNSFVDFMLVRDHRARFRFSALQGRTFSAQFGKDQPSMGTSDGPKTQRLASIVFWDGQGTHTKSEAALRVVEGLGGKWLFARPLRLIPRPLRDMVYDLVAANRYRWFGRRDSCRVPSSDEQERFLP